MFVKVLNILASLFDKDMCLVEKQKPLVPKSMKLTLYNYFSSKPEIDEEDDLQLWSNL